MPYTVGELARRTGVTVRLLHHYDEIGLVRPSARTPAGYRLYEDGDVLRLQQVLFFRELGFPLDEIADVLDADGFDRASALREQRRALEARRAQVDDKIAAIDAALASLEKGTPMNPDDFKALFDGFDPSVHEDEARQRWGQTDAYQESARRTRGYGKAEWEQIKRESAATYAALAARMQAGDAPDAPAVQALVADHRAHITRWFYPCSHALHRGLARMYVDDPRFAANIDKAGGPGLARFLSAAILAGPPAEDDDGGGAP